MKIIKNSTKKSSFIITLAECKQGSCFGIFLCVLEFFKKPCKSRTRFLVPRRFRGGSEFRITKTCWWKKYKNIVFATLQICKMDCTVTCVCANQASSCPHIPKLSPNRKIAPKSPNVPKLSLFVQICYKNLKTLIYIVRGFSKPVMSHYLYF
jgi:hypothetical protein